MNAPKIMCHIITCSSGTRNVFFSRLLVVSGLVALSTTLWATAPQWWTNPGRTVVAPGPVDDFAACNIGQLKNMAWQAAAELDLNLDGGAGTEIHALVAGWQASAGQPDDFLMVNVGQLKAVAKPFYDRLLASGTAGITGYPWAAASSQDDFAAVNVGQLKYVFEFEVPPKPPTQPSDGGSGGDTHNNDNPGNPGNTGNPGNNGTPPNEGPGVVATVAPGGWSTNASSQNTQGGSSSGSGSLVVTITFPEDGHTVR